MKLATTILVLITLSSQTFASQGVFKCVGGSDDTAIFYTEEISNNVGHSKPVPSTYSPNLAISNNAIRNSSDFGHAYMDVIKNINGRPVRTRTEFSNWGTGHSQTPGGEEYIRSDNYWHSSNSVKSLVFFVFKTAVDECYRGELSLYEWSAHGASSATGSDMYCSYNIDPAQCRMTLTKKIDLVP